MDLIRTASEMLWHVVPSSNSADTLTCIVESFTAVNSTEDTLVWIAVAFTGMALTSRRSFHRLSSYHEFVLIVLFISVIAVTEMRELASPPKCQRFLELALFVHVTVDYRYIFTVL